MNNSGQSQIIIAAGMGAAMLTGALFMVQYTLQTKTASIVSGKRTEMRTVLDEAIKHAAYLYRAESGCDPVSLNGKLARLKSDGTLMPPGTSFTPRGLQLTVNGTPYWVSYGYAISLKWSDDGTSAPDPSLPASGPTIGVSQDASLQVWTTDGYQRVTENVVFINDCSYSCAPEAAAATANPTALWAPSADQCLTATDSAVAYHDVYKIKSFPGAYPAPVGFAQPGVACAAVPARNLGNIKVQSLAPPNPPTSCAPVPAPASDSLNIDDIIALKNYLRSQDTAGTCLTLTACADVNKDGLVDETDLSILEKVLRGYLYWLPVHY